ncbi:MAG: tyrosine-type recombinase/integrase [Emcibacter sp.]|nr:tyrosine-type recombinase/integrase [Emcibacter sp.]
MIGRTCVTNLSDTNVVELHQSMSDKPYQANRTIGVLSIMMKQAEKWGYREKNTNPCYSVEKFKEKGRERFLSSKELQRLGKALSDFETEKPIPVALIRLLIFTGCRLSEIQTLKWQYVDLKKRQLNLPDSKTGEKIIYFGKECEQILRNTIRFPDNPYVITGALEGDHLKEIQKPWRKIRAAASLDDVRIHDLRHTFASHGVILTGSLPIVGKLLGHTRPETTARYAHLAADPIREAAQDVSEAISKSLYYTEEKDEPEEHIGKRLLNLRERLGINQRTVENRTKLDTSDIRAIENGDNMPINTVMAYADAIGYKLSVSPIG